MKKGLVHILARMGRKVEAVDEDGEVLCSILGAGIDIYHPWLAVSTGFRNSMRPIPTSRKLSLPSLSPFYRIIFLNFVGGNL